MPRRDSTACPRKMVFIFLSSAGKDDGEGKICLNRWRATCCVAEWRSCGQRTSTAPLAVEVCLRNIAQWRLRHSPYGKGKGNRAMGMVRVNILRSLITVLSVVSNALRLTSPLPFAVALCTTRATSGHLWSPTVYRRSRALPHAPNPFWFASEFLANEAANVVNTMAMTIVNDIDFQELLRPRG